MKDRVVVIKFPTWSYQPQDIVNQFKGISQFLQEKGYDWDVIMIPRDCEWTEMTYEELRNFRDSINEILEEKPNDSNNEARTGIEACS